MALNMAEIQALLEAQVIEALGTLDDVPAIAWPNVALTATDTYVEVTQLVAAEPTTGGLAFGSFDKYSGFIQVNVVTPKGTGSQRTRELVATLLQWFSKGLVLGSGIAAPPIGALVGRLRITKSWPAPALDRSEAWVLTPVTIQWRLEQ